MSRKISQSGKTASALEADRCKVGKNYRPELDVVRFLAFLLVYFSHLLLCTPIGLWSFLPTHQDPTRIVYAIGNSCSMGLCLFFTLSAYLITGLLLKERDKNTVVSVRKFYIRRCLRIWPLYFFGIAIGVALRNTHESLTQSGLLWNLLFVGNFFRAAYGSSNNVMAPLWSISIEEQFYVVWPWAMRWLSRRRLAVCALCFILAANLALYILGERHADTDTTVWSNTLVQFEMFAAGILLALADKPAPRIFRGIGFALVFTGPLLWFIACFLFHAKQPAVAGMAVSGPALMAGYALIAVGCVAVLKGFCFFGPSRMPQWAVYMGKISYGLYVFHELGIRLAICFFAPSDGFISLIAAALLSLILTITAAKLSYTFLERPFLRIKRKYEIVHSKPIE